MMVLEMPFRRVRRVPLTKSSIYLLDLPCFNLSDECKFRGKYNRTSNYNGQTEHQLVDLSDEHKCRGGWGRCVLLSGEKV